ncbi:unnamed protein product [Rhodiola kirilowii]
MASCFSDSSVSIADASCSSACISPNTSLSIQNTVVYVYRIILSTSKLLQVEVNWNKCQDYQGLSITFNNSATPSFKLTTNSRIFRKLKGSRIVESNSYKIEVFWDLSLSKYQSGPEPVDGYYVIVMVDSEVGLVVGDLAKEAAKRKFEKGTRYAKSSLLVRRDYCAGNTLFSTRAKFSENSAHHDISIRCSGEQEEWLNHPFFSICIDKKEVIRVERLNWNFRGNQTLFFEGLMIDLLWDVNEWLINRFSGSAIFMFRMRSGMNLDSRVWLEDEDEEEKETLLRKEQDMGGEYSLLIYACKSI